MNKIIAYFSDVPDTHRIYLLAFSMALFAGFEHFFEFKKGAYKWRQILGNCLFMLPAAPVQLAIGALLVLAIRTAEHSHIGLLNMLPFHLSPFLAFVLSFVLLDLCEYVYHVVMHKIKRLWMFHLVHHSDRELNVYTTLREHPIETGIRLLFLVVWVLLIGVSFWALLFRQFIQIFSNVFVHANFRLPERTDKMISLVFVTPNMHQVHHHYKRPYTDTNYGDVLSIWDRLFGTFATAEAGELLFGVDTHFDRNENSRFLKLLKIPFGRYRSSSN